MRGACEAAAVKKPSAAIAMNIPYLSALERAKDARFACVDIIVACSKMAGVGS